MKLFDAHNHLQDQRIEDSLPTVMAECRHQQIAKMVVNGSCEDDWPRVRQLAQYYPEVCPAFGYHPWYLDQATPEWRENLIAHLETPQASIGETGLDRWKEGLDFAQQVIFFTTQLTIAYERNIAISIHCLKAWGPLLEILTDTPPPARGFLIHSYSGSVEMIAPLVKRGAYFSCAGNYLAQSKRQKWEIFRHVPLERLLVESDAPDQSLPKEHEIFPLIDQASGERINHPGNIAETYRQLAETRGLAMEDFTAQIEENFRRLFLD